MKTKEDIISAIEQAEADIASVVRGRKYFALNDGEREYVYEARMFITDMKWVLDD